MESVIITNIAMEPIKIVPWQEAVNMFYRGIAFPLESSDIIKTVNSPSCSINIYRIMYVNYYHAPDHKMIYDLNHIAAKINVLIRDNYTCAYCLGFGDTIDHIIPKSRGGTFTYGNLITACRDCNSKKKNHTPEECGMKLHFKPTEFDPMQRKAYRFKRERIEVAQALAIA